MDAGMTITGSQAATHESLAMRRDLILMAVCAPFTDLAWPTERLRRIGILWTRPRRPQGLADFVAAQMSVLGWKEGRDYVFEYRVTGEIAERLASAAAELVVSRVDVFLCLSTAQVLAVQKATATIPIVMTGVSDPVASGLVRSLARPEGNITGFAAIGDQLNGKRLSLVRELLPTIRTLAVVWSAEDATHPREMQQIEVIAPTLGLEVRRVELSRVEDIGLVFEQLQRNPPGAVLLLGNIWRGSAGGAVERAALNAGLPAVGYARQDAESGALLGYGPDYDSMLLDAVAYIVKILKGAKVADLPIQQPTKFELGINLKTARALGLSVPRTLLLRADAVIE